VEVDREEVEEPPRGAEDADEDVTRKRRRRRRTKGAAEEEEEEEKEGEGEGTLARMRLGLAPVDLLIDPNRFADRTLRRFLTCPPGFQPLPAPPASATVIPCHLLMCLVASSLFQMRERESRP